MLTKYNWLQEDNRLLWLNKRCDLSGNILIPFESSLYSSFFNNANLVIPSSPIIEPFIQLSDDAVLKYPHVESNGKVCLQTELRSNITEEQYINQLIQSFIDSFLKKITSGEIQEDFYDEPENYWCIFVKDFAKKNKIKTIPINKNKHKTTGIVDYPSQLLLLNKRISSFIEYTSIILGKNRIIASLESFYKKKLIENYSLTKKNLLTIEIPLNECYLPKRWPKCIDELFDTITTFTNNELAQKYTQPFRLIILRAETCNYAYFINENNKLIPLCCERADIEWMYGRYKNNNIIRNQPRKIVCFGAGSLGSQVVPLLVKEGIGEIIIVDNELFDTPNLGRHLLGINSLNKFKASEISHYINAHLPTSKIIPENITVDRWLQKAENNNLLDKIELFIDLTGSEKVRNALDKVRSEYHIPMIAGWMEPFVSSAHTAFFPGNKFWKTQEVNLWEEIAAFRGWPEKYMENELGCSSRFQSYSGIEALKAVSLVAEACANFFSCDDISNFSQIEVTSLVRGKEFCERQECQAEERASWAEIPLNLDSAIIKRLFK